MGINLTNFLSSKSKSKRMMEFQDLDHIDGVSISAVSANLYNSSRDDLVMFILEMGQIMHLYILNQKLFQKI